MQVYIFLKDRENRKRTSVKVSRFLSNSQIPSKSPISTCSTKSPLSKGTLSYLIRIFPKLWRSFTRDRHFRRTRIVGPTTGTGNEKRRTLRKYLTRSSARKKKKRISCLGCKYGNQFKATRFCKKPIVISLALFFICSCYSTAKANPMTSRRTTILVFFMLFVISLEAAAIDDKNVSCGNKKQGNDSHVKALLQIN